MLRRLNRGACILQDKEEVLYLRAVAHRKSISNKTRVQHVRQIVRAAVNILEPRCALLTQVRKILVVDDVVPNNFEDYWVV